MDPSRPADVSHAGTSRDVADVTPSVDDPAEPKPGLGRRRGQLAALRRANELFMAVFEASPLGMSMVDFDGRFVLVNRALSEMLGTPADELIGAAVSERTHPDDRDSLAAVLVEMRTRAAPTPPYDKRFLRANGSVLWARVTPFPVMVDGEPLWFGAVVEDLDGSAGLVAARNAERDRFEAIVEHSSERITVLSPDWTILYMSPASRATLGVRPGDRLPLDRLHPDDLPTALEEFAATVADPSHRGLMVGRVQMADGGWRHIETTMTNLLDNPAVGGVVFNGRDVTEQRAHQTRFEAIIENSSDIHSVWTADGHHLSASPHSRQLWGLVDSGSHPIHPDDVALVGRAFRSVVEGPDLQRTVSYRATSVDGRCLHLESTLTNMLHVPEVAGIVTNTRDVTDRVKAAESLAYQAFHDALTDLPNRAGLIVQLVEGPSSLITVALMDLDHFRLINDTLGYTAGDDLLYQVARRLAEVVQPGETVARVGGDEFAVIARTGDSEDAVGLARRMLAAVAAPVFLPGGEQVVVSASVGITVGESAAPDTLLRNADAALYQAKDQGRDCFAIFDDRLLDRALRRHTTEQRLRKALAENCFGVGYQPVVDLRSGVVVKAEALLRMPLGAPELDVHEIITVAEETGLILQIGDRMLREACGRAAAWAQQPGDTGSVTVAVNVSARQLAGGSFARDVEGHLAAAGLDPSSLCLELTETTLLEASRRTEQTIADLKSLGVLLALDDFGTGYSSLTYLKRFPLDYLKIDRSFVDGLGSDPGDTAIVRAVVALSQAFGLHTVAEGVETEAQCMALRALGCDMAQGYYFSRAVPEPDFVALLRTTPRW